MDKKNLIILFSVFVLLLSVLLVKNNINFGIKKGLAADIEKIRKIEITPPKKSETTVLKTEGKWYVSEEGWPADKEKIERVLKAVENAELNEIISMRRETHDEFEVTPEKGVQVTLWNIEGDSVTFVSGKQSPDITKSYLSIKGRPEVYMVSGLSRRIFSRDEDYWKESRIINYKAGDVEKIEISFEGSSYTVNKDTAAWKENYSRISSLRAVGYESNTAKYKENIDSPYLELNLKLKDGSVQSYKIISDGSSYYVKPSEKELLYKVTEAAVKKVKTLIPAEKAR